MADRRRSGSGRLAGCPRFELAAHVLDGVWSLVETLKIKIQSRFNQNSDCYCDCGLAVTFDEQHITQGPRHQGGIRRARRDCV